VLISCDQCRTTFTLPDEFIAPAGTAVHCTRCLHTFTAHRPLGPSPGERKPLFVTCERCTTVFTLDPHHVPEGGATVQCSACEHSFWLPRDPPRRDVMIFGSAPPPVPPVRPDPLLEALYEQVWAAPDDDAPRSVLADHLTERGDPRGELLAIQLAEPDGPTGLAKGRAKQLKRHYVDWLPKGVEPHTAVFHRGFLRACRWVAPTDPSHREWKTVERLDCAGGAVDFNRDPLFAANALPRLKEVRAADARSFVALCSSPVRERLEHLHTNSLSLAPLVEHLESLASFAALSSLDLEGTELNDETLALICRSVPRELRRLRVDDSRTDGASLRLVAAREALRAAPGLTLTIHVDLDRLCWFELFGDEVRLCHRRSAHAGTRDLLIARARREGLRATLVPVDEPA
jgi:predicted Zn finger-like uncharacterized protein/uncharacterized protein (TIGR02996 family)